MPNMRKSDDIVGIVLSDVHWSARPPIARSLEPDWFEAQARPWREVADISHKHQCPIFVAGDFFHHWNQPPEIINYIIRLFQDLEIKPYTIPGQHDLPNHRYDLIEKSAYWTLVEAEAIHDLEASDGKPCIINNKISVNAFPWGFPIKPPAIELNGIKLALVHSYIWTTGKSFPGASTEQRVHAYQPKLSGYTAAAFGDNHIGFLDDVCNIMNCGMFVRRTIDEFDRVPQIGLLCANGIIKPHQLDVSKDAAPPAISHIAAVESIDIKNFIHELANLDTTDIEYEEAMRRYLATHDVPDRTKQILMDLLCL